MKQYLLSVHNEADAPVPSEEEMEAMFAAVDDFNTAVQAAGNWVFAGGLHPAEVATVVDATSGEVLTTDGPYAEAKEHLGGFWVLKVDDLDAALDLARQASAACRAPIEVRPFQDDAEE